MPAEERERSVGHALRRLRDQVGYSIKDAAEGLNWSSSKLSRIETGASRVKDVDVGRILDLYRADELARSEIEHLRDEPAPDDASAALPHSYEQYSALEARASKVSAYGAMVVPGLLQIPEYADALIRATPENEDHLARKRLGKRLERQIILASVELDVIIDESVLNRVIGSDDVMRRQMSWLRDFRLRQNTSVRILPFSAGAHPALNGQFAILDFADNESPCVFCDGLTGGVLRSRADEVHRYRACFQALKRLALSADESAEKFTSAL